MTCFSFSMDLPQSFPLTCIWDLRFEIVVAVPFKCGKFPSFFSVSSNGKIWIFSIHPNLLRPLFHPSSGVTRRFAPLEETRNKLGAERVKSRKSNRFASRSAGHPNERFSAPWIEGFKRNAKINSGVNLDHSHAFKSAACSSILVHSCLLLLLLGSALSVV